MYDGVTLKVSNRFVDGCKADDKQGLSKKRKYKANLVAEKRNKIIQRRSMPGGNTMRALAPPGLNIRP